MVSYIGSGLNAPGGEAVGQSFVSSGPVVQEVDAGGGGGDDDTQVMVTREGMTDKSWFGLINHK